MCFSMVIGETETDKLIQRQREAARMLNRKASNRRKRANERSGLSRSERAREHEKDRERERKKETSIEFFLLEGCREKEMATSMRKQVSRDTERTRERESKR